MAYDALEALQTLVTKSTGFSSTAVDLLTGTPRRGLKARVIVTAASQQGGNGVVSFTIDGSSDNTTFVTMATSEVFITNSATAASKVLFIPFETNLRYVRLTMANTISTGTASIAYLGEIGNSRPG